MLLLFHDIGIPPALGYLIIAICIAGPILSILGLIQLCRGAVVVSVLKIALIATGICTFLAVAYFLKFLQPVSYFDYEGLFATTAFPFGFSTYMATSVALKISFFAVPVGAIANFLAFVGIFSFMGRRSPKFP